jgi:hypothetical protein
LIENTPEVRIGEAEMSGIVDVGFGWVQKPFTALKGGIADFSLANSFGRIRLSE